MTPKSTILQKTAKLYISKSTVFKLLLLFGIAVISFVFVWYTFSVIDQLQEDTRSQVDKYVKMWQLAANSPTSGSELQFIFDEIIVKAAFPIVVLDDKREPIHWRNIDGVAPDDTTAQTIAHLKEVAEDMVRSHGEFPLYYGDNFLNYFCYGDSKVIQQLQMMPFIEIGILVAFLVLAFIGFQNMRQSEERYIWVGMAKETAHQLGTPISSLMGWLEVIGASDKCKNDEKLTVDFETVKDMQADIERLQRVANRFGWIGSKPEVGPCDLNRLIQESVAYYQRRLPFEGKGIKMTFEPGDLPETKLNAELVGWVLENLIKNALQATDPKSGRVKIRSSHIPGRRCVAVEIIDNGKGITPAAARKIFKAGFTTKKRGWGLGLTLVKRIIEEYHGGRVYLKRSKPGETVFAVLLPVAHD
jgi:signal transduction histidine kinase